MRGALPHMGSRPLSERVLARGIGPSGNVTRSRRLLGCNGAQVLVIVGVLLAAGLPLLNPTALHAPGVSGSGSVGHQRFLLANSGGSDPNVTVQPNASRVGASVTLSGGGFQSSSVLTFYLNVSAGASYGPFALCSTNSTGNFSCPANVPAVPAGPYLLNVTDFVNNATTNFTVLSPSLSVSPATGYIGSQATVNGSGFAPGQTATLTFGGEHQNNSSCTSGSSLHVNATGEFSCTFQIPAHVEGAITLRANDTLNAATASFRILAPTLRISPTSGIVNSTVDATGRGYAPKVLVELTIGHDLITICRSSTSLLSNDTGHFHCKFGVPPLRAATYLVNATDRINSAAPQSFTIGPPFLVLNISSGPVGSDIQATGSGFAANVPVSLKFNLTSVTCLSGGNKTNSSGGFACVFRAPANPVGNQTVLAYDGANNATSNFSIEPSLSLNPTHGSFGESVNVSGTGFPGKGAAEVESDLMTSPLCTVAETDANGSFQCSFQVPKAYGGNHTVTATASIYTANATFVVDPSGALSPDAGAVGQPVTVNGYGFRASTPITVQWDYTITECSGSSTGPKGSVTCSFDVPPSPGGLHVVTLVQAGVYEVNLSFSVTVTFDINPAAGVVGTDVTLTGTGFAASTTYTVCLNSTTTEPCVSGQSVTTLSNGSIPEGTLFTVGVFTAGSYYLVISLAIPVAWQSFTVTTALVSLSHSSGPAGTLLSLSGSGFASLTVYEYCFQLMATSCPSGTPLSFTSTSSGEIPSGIAPLPVPASPFGQYYVDVSEGSILVGVADFSVVSNLTANFRSVTVGTLLTASGTGYGASAPFTVAWDAKSDVCSGTTGANGSFVCTFAVPPATYGPHTLNASTAGVYATFSISIFSALTSTPSSGTVGSGVEVIGTGYASVQAYSIVWGSITTICSGLTNATGNLACSFAVPQAPAGSHPINASVGSLKNETLFAVVPAVSASPTSGSVGSLAVLTGTGFDANAPYTLLWNGTTTLSCSDLTDADGGISCAFTVPVAPGGVTPIVVNEASFLLTTNFTVTPTVGISPHVGTVGSRAEITGQGLFATETFSLFWNDSMALCSGSASAAGQYDCNFTIPAAPGGTHLLTWEQGSSSFTLEFTIVPAFSISLSSGPVGTAVSASGNGFDATASFALAWNASTALCSGTTSASGELSCSFVTPYAPGGVHSINVTEGSYSLSASFKITPSLEISPTTAAVGSTVTVSGEGFAANSPYAVSWTATGLLCSGTTNTNGGFACSFVVPSVIAGNYTISGTQGTSSPSGTLFVTGSTPPPSKVSSTPFPWWALAVIVVGGVAGLLAILLYYRRRPGPKPREMQPWEETPPGSPAAAGGARPVPLYPSPPTGSMAATTPPPVSSTAPAPSAAAEQPPEDIDVMISKLDRMAKELFKNKPPVEEAEESTTNSQTGSAQ